MEVPGSSTCPRALAEEHERKVEAWRLATVETWKARQAIWEELKDVKSQVLELAAEQPILEDRSLPDPIPDGDLPAVVDRIVDLHAELQRLIRGLQDSATVLQTCKFNEVHLALEILPAREDVGPLWTAELPRTPLDTPPL